MAPQAIQFYPSNHLVYNIHDDEETASNEMRVSTTTIVINATASFPIYKSNDSLYYTFVFLRVGTYTCPPIRLKHDIIKIYDIPIYIIHRRSKKRIGLIGMNNHESK